MRQSIVDAGGEVHFNAHVIDFIIKDNSVKGVIS